jgi:ribonuclease BN (tRNA processing enzyme)
MVFWPKGLGGVFTRFCMETTDVSIMPSLSFLGTGSGLPSADRFFSSVVLLLAGHHLLIDVGEPCVHLLRERGDLIREIDAILITHGHVDHIGGLPAFLQGAMLLQRSKPLAIYLPEEMILPLRAWIMALYLTEEGLSFPVAWNAWQPSKPTALDGGISLTAHPNTHLESCYRRLPGADLARTCASYSLEITCGEFRSIFSGDLSVATELAPLLTKPTTLLVSELSHFSVEQLAAVLDNTTLHTLCLVHLSEDYASDRSLLQEYLEKHLPPMIDVMIPADGEVLDF